MTEIWSLLLLMGTVLAILALAYFCTRWIAARGAPNFTRIHGDEALCILRQMNVGKNERLLLVRLQNRCLLVGVTAGSMSVLTELTPEEAEKWLNDADDSTPPSFLEAIQTTVSKISKKK